eukprot:scaffold8408_cov149-Isochrysis_galbana.AAC.1
MGEGRGSDRTAIGQCVFRRRAASGSLIGLGGGAWRPEVPAQETGGRTRPRRGIANSRRRP